MRQAPCGGGRLSLRRCQRARSDVRTATAAGAAASARAAQAGLSVIVFAAAASDGTNAAAHGHPACPYDRLHRKQPEEKLSSLGRLLTPPCFLVWEPPKASQ
eukprot:78823-Chlamydomonas_euryale.AAC.12